MSPRANVRSLDAIREFRPSVIRFEDEVKSALTGLRTELNRTMQWLDHDCPAYWQQQIRNGFDTVNEARTTLSRKGMITVAGHKSDCIDEKKALERAKKQLEFSQQKLQVCRQWSIKAHRASDEYSSRIGRAEQTINHELPRILVILEKVVLALEAYSSVERPSRSDNYISANGDPSPVKSAAGPAEPAPPQTGAEQTPTEESLLSPADVEASMGPNEAARSQP